MKVKLSPKKTILLGLFMSSVLFTYGQTVYGAPSIGNSGLNAGGSAASAATPTKSTSTSTKSSQVTSSTKAEEDCPDGVLIKECTKNLTLSQYLKAALKQLIPLILFIAMIMIAWSGVQYMLSGFKPDNATKAKQRIVGIIIGAIFFLSIGVVINWLSPNLGL